MAVGKSRNATATGGTARRGNSAVYPTAGAGGYHAGPITTGATDQGAWGVGMTGLLTWRNLAHDRSRLVVTMVWIVFGG